jgi:hypothetical protein
MDNAGVLELAQRRRYCRESIVYMVLLSCSLELWSDKSLEEVAEVISKHLLGGVGFIGKSECIRDEIPTIYSEADILGMRVILMGEPGQKGYYLEMETRREHGVVLTAEQTMKSLVDITSLVSKLLNGVEGITVSFKGV